jgi:hypothetical protein
MNILLLVLLLFCVCGCSPQKTLARRLKDADRLVVLDPYDARTITVTGEQLTNVIHALEVCQRISSRGLADSPDFVLIFFRAAVHVATLQTGSGVVFYIDHRPYEDRSRSLSPVRQKFQEQYLRLRDPMPQDGSR